MNAKNQNVSPIAALLLTGLFVGCVTSDSQPPAAAVVTPPPAPALTAPVVSTAPAAQPDHAKPGFETVLDKDGRLWIFRAGSPEWAEFQAKGAPARHVVRPGAGPNGLTIKAVDAEILDAYVTAKPGFETVLDKDGRLWIFRAGSPEWAEFQAKGVPARHVVRPGAGPNGLTIKAVDAEILDAYLAR